MTVANVATRDLTAIATEIRARAQTIADVIEIGGLLIEAQAQLDHGEWLPWVERELDFTERTAQNYMAAYRFALKYETVAYSKLTTSALYKLACGFYEENEIATVLTVAAEERSHPRPRGRNSRGIRVTRRQARRRRSARGRVRQPRRCQSHCGLHS